MRILFVTPYFYPAWQYGGTPRAAFELAKAVSGRGHAIRVLTTDSAGDERIRPSPAVLRPALPEAEGLDIVYYRNISNYLAFRQRLFLPPKFFSEIRREVVASDVVHIHELRTMLAVTAARAARRSGVPYIISPHGGLRHLGKHTEKAVFDLLWGQNTLARADAILALTKPEEQESLQFGVDVSRIRSLPNIARTDEYRDLPQPGQFRQKHRIVAARLVLFLGRLHSIKGPDLLIRALAQTREDTWLVLAGPNDGFEPQLRELARELRVEDRVVFTGFLDGQEKREALVDSDVVVLPSRSEAFPVSALEALLCAKPVVMSSVCGLVESLGSQNGVASFRSEDVNDLAVRVEEALVSSKLRQNAIAGRELVLREFAADTVARRAEAIYEEVVSRRNRVKP